MDLHYLEYIVEISNMHSISKAAENLFITQSTLSQYLSRLEAELGIKLFERKRSEMILTTEGKLYVSVCQKMLKQKKDLYNQLSEIAAGKTGSFSLGITPQWGSVAFANIFGQFHSLYPNIQIEVHEEIAGPLIHSIQNGNLDMAIIPLADSGNFPDNSNLLHSEELLLAIPKKHAEKMKFTECDDGKPGISASELKKEPMIFSLNKTTIRHLQEDWFNKAGVTPEIVSELNSHPASITMVENEIGATFVPASCIIPKEGVVYAHAVPSVNWFVVIAFRKGFTIHSSIKYLVQLAKEYFEGI